MGLSTIHHLVPCTIMLAITQMPFKIQCGSGFKIVVRVGFWLQRITMETN